MLNETQRYQTLEFNDKKFVVSYASGSCGAFVATVMAYYLDSRIKLLMDQPGLSCHHSIRNEVKPPVKESHDYEFAKERSFKVVGIDYDEDDVPAIAILYLHKYLPLIDNWRQEDYDTFAGSDWPPYDPLNLRKDQVIIDEMLQFHRKGLSDRKATVDVTQFDYLLKFKTIMNLDGRDELNSILASIVGLPEKKQAQDFIHLYQTANYNAYLKDYFNAS